MSSSVKVYFVNNNYTSKNYNLSSRMFKIEVFLGLTHICWMCLKEHGNKHNQKGGIVKQLLRVCVYKIPLYESDFYLIHLTLLCLLLLTLFG